MVTTLHGWRPLLAQVRARHACILRCAPAKSWPLTATGCNEGIGAEEGKESDSYPEDHSRRRRRWEDLLQEVGVQRPLSRSSLTRWEHLQVLTMRRVLHRGQGRCRLVIRRPQWKWARLEAAVPSSDESDPGPVSLSLAVSRRFGCPRPYRGKACVETKIGQVVPFPTRRSNRAPWNVRSDPWLETGSS